MRPTAVIRQSYQSVLTTVVCHRVVNGQRTQCTARGVYCRLLQSAVNAITCV